MVNTLDVLLRAASLEAVFLAALVEKFLPILPSYVLYPAIGIGAEDGWTLAARCPSCTRPPRRVRGPAATTARTG